MQCSRCKKDFPSEFYFAAPDTCQECFDKLDDAAKAAVQKVVARAKTSAPLDLTPSGLLTALAIFYAVVGVYFTVLFVQAANSTPALATGSNMIVVLASSMGLCKLALALGVVQRSLQATHREIQELSARVAAAGERPSSQT